MTSPVHAVCKTNDSHTVIAMKIYVDGIAVFSTSASSIDTQVTIAAGSHKFTCQAYIAVIFICMEGSFCLP